jgi:hypothetical protein
MEEDEQKIKEEAKYLIAKTKQMMENMNLTSPSQNLEKRNTKINKSQSKNNNKSNSTAHYSNPSFDSSKLSPSRRSNALPYENYLINGKKINSESDMKINIKNLTKKISELTNVIQRLEKEIKSKDEIIDSLEKKLISSTQHIDNLNKMIIKDRSDNIQVENSNMKRKILDLEKKIKDNTFMYEEIIKEYKNKLSGLNNENDGNVNQLNKLSEDFQKLVINHHDVNYELKAKNNKVEEFKKKFEKQESNEKVNVKKIEQLEDTLKVLVNLIKNLFNEEREFYPLRSQLLDQIKYLTLP